MPDHYVCPFSRDRGDGEMYIKTVIKGGASYNVWEWQGRHEHYQTWKWNGLTVRGERPTNAGGVLPKYPGDPVHGRPRYSAFCWNKIRPQFFPEYAPYYSGFTYGQFDYHNINLARRWDDGDARRVKSASLSDVTVIFCAQGEHLGRGPDIINPDSHHTGKGTGTNAVFADSHVEWVRGTRIGWP